MRPSPAWPRAASTSCSPIRRGKLWQTKGAEIAATAVGYAEEGAHVRVILEAPGGYEVPVPAGWKLRKVIGKGKGQPAASVLVRKAAE